MHTLLHVLGLVDPSSSFYLFWSGIGANALAILVGVKGYFKLKRQRERHHRQLKDHIDYKFSKLTESEKA